MLCYYIVMSSSFGSLLKEYRKAKGLSVRQLAIQCKLNNTDISRLENGKIKKPSVSMLIAISKILGANMLALYLEGEKIYLAYQPIIDKCSSLSESQILQVIAYIDKLQGEAKDEI